MELLLTVLGLLLVLEGIPWFLSPRRVKVLLLALIGVGNPLLRMLGLSCMLLGVWLVYLGRS